MTNLVKKNLESKVYGRHASLKLFEKRPEDIVRAYVTRDGLFEFKSLLKYLADQKVAYHVVEKEELETITKATHHENICLIARTKKLPELKELLNSEGRSIILCLAEVQNPHNLGAIMRSAAHFGVKGILYESKVPVANSASAVRTAEGGAETVSALQVSDWGHVFDLGARAGYVNFATSGNQGQSLFETRFPEKVFLFLGAEKEGLPKQLLKKIEHLITVPGTGEVESLNVSNATTAVLTEWYRQGFSSK